MTDTASLDAVMQFRGFCALCGSPDARHRVCDAVAERLRAGDDPLEVADDHVPRSGLTMGDVERLRRLAVIAAWGAGPEDDGADEESA